MEFNGHKNWSHWNVNLWINNDESLYALAVDTLKHNRNRDDAALSVKMQLGEMGITHTPDGAPYSVSAIRAAMRGMER